MAQLEIQYPDGQVRERALPKGRSLVIGAAKDADIALKGEGIAPKHFRLTELAGKCKLEVSGKLDNVYVGGKAVRQAVLEIGDQIEIEDYIITLVAGQKAAKIDDYAPTFRSPLFLSIFGLFAFLAAAFFVVYLYYQQGRSDRMYEACVKDFTSGNFQKSIEVFDEFLKEFPEGEQADDIRVYRAEAEIRRFTDAGASSWHLALPKAEELIRNVRSLPLFKKRISEISSLFLNIGAGLAKAAKDNKDRERLGQATASVELIRKSFSATEVPDDKIRDINTAIEEARFTIIKNETYLASLKQMDELLTKANSIALYNEHRRLYQTYPDLRDDKECLARKNKARVAEIGLVKFEHAGEGKPAAVPTQAVPAQTVVQHRAAEGSKKTGKIAALTIADTLYAFDVGSGEVAWRKPLGFKPAFPAMLVPEDTSKLLAHSTLDNALVLLETATGNEIWREPLKQLYPNWQTRPLILASEIYLPAAMTDGSKRGVLLVHKLASGRATGQYVFPQPLLSAAFYDAVRKTVMVIGEQMSLYTLKVREQSCEQVSHLNHEPDTIRSIPVTSGPFLFVVENQGTNQAVLHCFAIDESNGLATRKQSERLNGLVRHPAIPAGGRLFLTTEADSFFVFDLGSERDKTPVSLASKSKDSLDPVKDTPYVVVAGEREFWTAGKRLKHYQLKLKDAEPEPAWQEQLDAPPVAQPLLIDGTLILVIKPTNSTTISVRGLNTTSRTETWRTDLLNVPAAVQVDPADTSRLLVTRIDSTESLPLAELNQDKIVHRKLEDFPARPIPGLQPLPEWAQGVVLWTGVGRSQLAYIASGKPARIVNLPGPASARPTPFAGGLLVPSDDGFLYWIDPTTGAELGEPFPAPYSDGQPIPFSAVAAITETDFAVVAGSSIRRLKIDREPFAHFTALGTEELQGGTVSSLISLGDRLLAAQADQLLVLDPRDFGLRKKISVGTRLTRAPLTTSQGILYIGDNASLMLVHKPDNGEVDLRWKSKLPSLPIGSPLLAADGLWTAFADGTISRWNLADGKTNEEITLGRAASEGPFLLGNRVAILTPDGSVASVALAASK